MAAFLDGGQSQGIVEARPPSPLLLLREDHGKPHGLLVGELQRRRLDLSNQVGSTWNFVIHKTLLQLSNQLRSSVFIVTQRGEI
jgi:hypothetical protein